MYIKWHTTPRQDRRFVPHDKARRKLSLSQRGVLFLYKLPELGRAGLETLCQPLGDKIVTISRAQGTSTFPANFMPIAAQNPCPCGYYGDYVKQCTTF